MNTNTTPLDADREVILQAALDNSFSSLGSIPTATSDEAKNPAASTTSGTTIATPPVATSEPQPASDAPEVPAPGDEWKAEYESNLAKWKHENAIQREKAEKVRGEWEAKRSATGPPATVGVSPGQKEPELGEHLAKIQRGATGELGTGWEEVSGTDSPAVISANVTPEITKQDLSPTSSSLTTERQAQAATTSRHQHSPSNSSNSKWDSSIPSSLTSSYPSLSLHDQHPHQDSRQPQPGTHHATRTHRDTGARNRAHDHQGTDQPQHPPASTAIFDSSLSTKTRAIALMGSLTINLFLPFVNGVMMGFGEIFAENVLWKWFGWTKSRNSRIGRGASGVADVGLGR